jgi:osmotically-inducible protein OsmY
MNRTSIILTMLVVAVPALVHAQQRLGTSGSTGYTGGSSATAGSSGMFGSRSLGSSLTAGNRGFAGGGTTAAGVQGAVPGLTTRTGADQQVGQLQGNERFTRGGRQAGQFVGADTTDLPSFLTELATGGLTGQRNRGQQGQRQGQGQNPNQQAARGGATRAGQQRANYRIARSVAFDYSPPTPATVRTQLGSRLQALPGVTALGPIEVTLQQRTVVLRGSVATAHDRDLAERLALLEAGVDQVQNELTIAPPSAPAAPTPPSPAN